MKKGIKGIGLMCLLLIGAFVANAQSSSSALPVSKGVQQYANKSDENAKKSHLQAHSVEFLPIVVSKGPTRPSSVTTVGNIESKGYPAWAISKDVARENHKRNSEKAVPQEQPDMNFSKDQPVSKR
jgi:hypothetical protein